MFLLFYLCNCLNCVFQNKSEYIAKFSEQVPSRWIGFLLNNRLLANQIEGHIHHFNSVPFISDEKINVILSHIGSSLVEAIWSARFYLTFCWCKVHGQRYLSSRVISVQYAVSHYDFLIWLCTSEFEKKQLSKLVIRTWKLMSARIN